MKEFKIEGAVLDQIPMIIGDGISEVPVFKLLCRAVDDNALLGFTLKPLAMDLIEAPAEKE